MCQFSVNVFLYYAAEYFKTAISNRDATKLIYLTTNGSPHVSGSRAKEEALSKAENVAKVMKEAIVRKSFGPVHRLLIEEMDNLKNMKYPLPINNEKWKPTIELLKMVESIQNLNLESNFLEDNIKKVQKYIENEKLQQATIYNENLVMLKIGELLTDSQTLRLWNYIKIIDDVNIAETDLEIEGMKEVLFLYIIRELELAKKFNSLFVDILVKYLEGIKAEQNDDNFDIIFQILESYTILSRCPGYCLIFSMQKEREGSETEVRNLEEVFKNTLGYVTKVVTDPSKEDIMNEILECLRYDVSVHDSFVCWFVGHGNSEELILRDDEKISRAEYLKEFVKQSIFPRKPKIFFMASCQGNRRFKIPIKRQGECNKCKIFCYLH